LKEKRMPVGIAVTVAGGIFWGFSGACSQYLFGEFGIDTRWLTAVRMIIAGIILIVWGFLKDRNSMRNIFRDGKDVLSLFAFAVFGLMFCQFSYMQAIRYSNAGTATVLEYTGPVMIMAASCLKSKKAPEKKEICAIVFAVAGTFILATHGNIHSMVITQKGLFWGLLAAVAFSLYTLLPVGIMKKWGSIAVTGYGMLIGGAVMTCVSRVWRIDVTLNIYSFSAVAAVCIFGTVLAFTMYLQGVKLIGAVKAGMLASVEPVAAAVFAAAWLGSEFSWVDVIGFVLIIATVFLLAKKTNMSEKKVTFE
jgi:drug/metabolite transporter (DMT)-like permease